MAEDVYAQLGFRCRLEWGRKGARRAAARGDLLVVVDTLRFSSAVTTAVHYGGIIYPCLETDDLAETARRVGAVAGVRRSGPEGRFSLSPRDYLNLAPGTKVALASPNGATCVRSVESVPHLFVGSLLNAAAVGAVVGRLLDESPFDLTVVACGERWPEPGEDGELRFALEDYLGAGAILSHLRHPRSPEALACEGAFLHARPKLEELLWESGSGRELREKGLGEDVHFAAQLDLLDSVPAMEGGCLTRWSP